MVVRRCGGGACDSARPASVECGVAVSTASAREWSGVPVPGMSSYAKQLVPTLASMHEGTALNTTRHKLQEMILN